MTGPLRDKLSAPVLDRPIVFFANDWYTDPTSKHHVATVLAESNDVVWVESSGMRAPNLADVGDLKRIWKKLTGARAQPSRPREPAPVRIVSPLAVPLPGFGPAERFNAGRYASAVADATSDMDGADGALLWVFTPTTEPYLSRIPHDGMIYHFVDRWWEFTEYDERIMRRHHERLCRGADVVFASALELVEDCRPYTDRVHLMRHGVDWAHFAAAATEELPTPDDIADVEGPVIGFFGLIHDWIDQDILLSVAEAHSDATLVLIGDTRVDVSRLAARSNVRLLGRKPYAELPAYSRRFDVALIPFVVNELTLAVNPIKLREYLSAGLPVVATALPEITILREQAGVHVADDPHHFVDLVGEVLAEERTSEDRSRQAAAMEKESWYGRTAEMVKLWREAR